MLDLLGDVGGLFDALKLIGGGLIHPVGLFNLAVALLVQNFSMVPTRQRDNTALKKQTRKLAYKDRSGRAVNDAIDRMTAQINHEA